MEHVLVSSCEDCKQKCCQFGPGPYKILAPEKFLENYNYADAYNTKCAALTSDGRCSVWGTEDFPIACRVHVCTNRSFTEEELKKIDQVNHERECDECDASYVLTYYDEKIKAWVDECESCSNKIGWKKVDITSVESTD